MQTDRHSALYESRFHGLQVENRQSPDDREITNKAYRNILNIFKFIKKENAKAIRNYEKSIS